MRSASVLIALVLVGFCFAQSPTWTISNPRVATILMGIDCTSPTSCVVAGDSMISTTDGFATINRQPSDSNAAVMFMALGLGNRTSGAASGLGFFNVKGSAYYNGTYWSASNVTGVFHASQDAGAINSANFYQVAQWSETITGEAGNGVMLSSDGGRTWTGQNWNHQTQARYGSFVSPLEGFVTGGTWPQEDTVTDHLRAMAKGRKVTRLTESIALLDGEIYHIPHKVLALSRAPLNSMVRRANDEYIGKISKTLDGGKTWTTVYSVQGVRSFYFNAIHCVSATQCWAVAEGLDSNGITMAQVVATSNGGTTWTTQTVVENGSLIGIRMLNSTMGWAVGGVHEPGKIAQGAFFQTTDGKTWTQNGEIINTYIFNVKPIDATHAFAVGAQGQVCSIFKYA